MNDISRMRLWRAMSTASARMVSEVRSCSRSACGCGRIRRNAVLSPTSHAHAPRTSSPRASAPHPGPALGLLWLLHERRWRLESELLFSAVCGGGALLGLAARALYVRGRVRAANGLGLAVIAGTVGLAVYRIEAWDWLDAVTAVVTAAGPLGVAIYALRWTRGTAGFAIGAAVAAAMSWCFWPVPALVALSFVIGRDSFGAAKTTPRHALSQVGFGVLGMLMVTAISFDLVALLVDTFRPDTLMWRAHVDGPGTYVPRLVVEGVFVAAALGHARGRSWSVLALAVFAPVLAFLVTGASPLPAMGGGCIAWLHPLYALRVEENAVFGVAVAIAVLPWTGPVVRAMRSTRS